MFVVPLKGAPLFAEIAILAGLAYLTYLSQGSSLALTFGIMAAWIVGYGDYRIGAQIKSAVRGDKMPRSVLFVLFYSCTMTCVLIIVGRNLVILSNHVG